MLALKFKSLPLLVCSFLSRETVQIYANNVLKGNLRLYLFLRGRVTETICILFCSIWVYGASFSLHNVQIKKSSDLRNTYERWQLDNMFLG